MYIKKYAVFSKMEISAPKWDKCTIMNICPGSPEFQITGKYLKQPGGYIFHIHFGIKKVQQIAGLKVGMKIISISDFRKASPVHHPCF